MPRIQALAMEYKAKDTKQWISDEMRHQGITQAHLARKMNCHVNTFGNKLKHMTFSYRDLIVIFDELGADQETRAKAMTV